MKVEDIKIGDSLTMMGRAVLVVNDIDNENRQLHTSIGPVPFENVWMLQKKKP